MASTLSIAVIAASASPNVSIKNPSVSVKLVDQTINKPTVEDRNEAYMRAELEGDIIECK